METAPRMTETAMPLLQTLLSVVLTLGFLTALILGLLLILKTLESIRGSLEKIAMGVRAIERQLAPMEEHVEGAYSAVGRLSGLLDGAARRVRRTEGTLAGGKANPGDGGPR